MKPHRKGGKKTCINVGERTMKRSVSTRHVRSPIKMHGNRLALSLFPPGLHNQLKLLAPQNQENWAKTCPHFRLVVMMVNWLQGRLFIFRRDLKEKDEDLLAKLGTWDGSPSAMRGLSREIKINKHRGAPETLPWKLGCEYKLFSNVSSAVCSNQFCLRFSAKCAIHLRRQRHTLCVPQVCHFHRAED